ncbi:MAG: hypothetical protein ABSF56_01225 [Minisyncoccia bacterium]|jgi:hypothetical protein
MASRIGKGEWIALYAATGAIDLIQFLIDFTGVGAGVNEAADPFIGVALGGYFQLRGVSMIKNISRLMSLLGVVGLEEVTFGVAPAWVVDTWYIHKTVRQEKVEQEEQEQGEAVTLNVADRPLNQDGRREPSADGSKPSRNQGLQPLNVDGVRSPRPSLSSTIGSAEFKSRTEKEIQDKTYIQAKLRGYTEEQATEQATNATKPDYKQVWKAHGDS